MNDVIALRVIVLVSGDEEHLSTAALGAESSPLGRLLAEANGIEVGIVSPGGVWRPDTWPDHISLENSPVPAIDHLMSAIGLYLLREMFSRFPIGRLLNSLGPLAPSRVFWRTLKNHPGAMSALRSADAVVAADLGATKAAWIAAHRGWVRNAYYDRRGAASLLRGSR